jgi:hypothetical protein
MRNLRRIDAQVRLKNRIRMGTKGEIPSPAEKLPVRVLIPSPKCRFQRRDGIW